MPNPVKPDVVGEILDRLYYVDLNQMTVKQARQALMTAIRESRPVKKDKGYFLIRITHDDIEMANIQSRSMEIGYEQALTDFTKALEDLILFKK